MAAKNKHKKKSVVKKTTKAPKKAAAKKPVTKIKKAIKKVIKKAVKAKKPVAKKPAKNPTRKIIKKPVKPTSKTHKTISKKTPKVVKKVVKKEIKQEVKTAPKPTQKLKTEHSAKPTSKIFKVGEYAVYPAHGIGKIIGLEHTKVMGEDFSCYLMFFEKEKLTIKIPLKNIEKIGLRPLVSKAQMEEVFAILRSGIKKLKGMWSRRAQEYESKINSGDIIMLAEVLRDLTRDIEDGDRSYSERIIYETAVARLAAEYAAIHNIDFEVAKEKVTTTAKDKLNIEQKQPRNNAFDDYDDKEEDGEEENEEEDEDEEEDEEEDEDDYYDDEDDDEPKKRKRK